MLKKLEPQNIRLWVEYLENNVSKSGLSLTVQGEYNNGDVVFTSQSMTEEGSSGYYYYDWNASSVDLLRLIRIIYKNGSELIGIEEFQFDIFDDQDGIAM